MFGGRGQLTVIIAGLLASVSAYVLNFAAVRIWAAQAVRWLVPAIEELSKTGSAYLFGAPILPTHGFFAIVEAVYDLSAGSEIGRVGALISLVGHIAFGAVTVGVVRLGGSVWHGIGASILVHLLWNTIAMRVPKRRVRG